MPGTIKIGNEGFRSTIKTDGNNNLIISTPNADSTINFYSGSDSTAANRIRFIQDMNIYAGVTSSRAIIHLSSSNIGNGGYNIDTPTFDRAIRADRDLFLTTNANVFNVGLSSANLTKDRVRFSWSSFEAASTDTDITGSGKSIDSN